MTPCWGEVKVDAANTADDEDDAEDGDDNDDDSDGDAWRLLLPV